MKIAVHITHESVKKIGGIGAVLSGVCNLKNYSRFYDKTLFYGPLFELTTDTFKHFGKLGQLLYSSHGDYDNGEYSKLFDDVRKKYNIDIVYGTRELCSEFDISKHINIDVLNIGINSMNNEEIEKFKYLLWKDYGIKSHLYEDDWDYQQYLRIAIPFLELLKKLYPADSSFYHFAHEYMGMPSVLSVLSAGKKDKTIFIAHEVSTARSIVEKHHGHDVSFYNILNKSKDGKTLEHIFGSQEHNPRNELVKRAVNCDHIFAVGDHVKEEYRFLVPETPEDKIKIVYNGISARTVDIDQKLRSRNHLISYIDSLFNFKPDVIFTHVTRLVISKGIWRDLELLNALDKIFHEKKIKGVYILLSTVIGTGRSPEDIFQMEKDYGWPVMHQNGWPDLVGNEIDTYQQIQIFNAKSRAIKAVFLNQFGFNRTRCGKRVPQDAEFDDIRIGSDAELGLSIYEPFGIAQIETIPFGGIAILSSSCGSCFLLKKKFDDSKLKPYYIIDYISPAKKLSMTSLKKISIKQRDEIERKVISKQAEDIFNILPSSDQKRSEYLKNAHKYTPAISWDSVAGDYIFDSNPST